MADVLDSNANLQKVLYYGYGGAGDLTGSYLSGKSDNEKYVYTHIAASYAYAGDAAFTGCDYSALVADGVIDIFLLSPGCWNVRACVILYQCQFPVPSANLRVYGVACGV